MITRIHTERFTYKDRDFAVCVSSLKGFDLFSRVFNDACDEGFALVSGRTGKEVIVTHEETKYDAEGDLLYWTFVPYGNTSFNQVVVFND